MERNTFNFLNRRQFLFTFGSITGTALLGVNPIISKIRDENMGKKITIHKVDSNFEREPLVRPFGFKGGYMSEIWQTIAYMQSTAEIHQIGLCTQNVLWSDAEVFASHSESGGNALMYAITERALQMVRGSSFTTPIDLLGKVLPEIYEYGKKITHKNNLRKTFALNALVGFDNAAWLLYAAENKIKDFDTMIPEEYRKGIATKHKQVAAIPLFSYAVPIKEIKEAVEQGYFFMKIKIGQPGSQSEMLEKDKVRLTQIHQAIGHMQTPHTDDGKIPYYFDANGRYENKETLLKLLDHAKKIGAFEQITVIEEPFPEELDIHVGDIGVRIAADESAHTDEDAVQRIEMGYKAIALKPIAKTLSMTLRIIKIAHENKIPCFCADLTVNPILVDWNKVIAARLAPLPGFNMGLLETNGHQNYINWSKMRSYHPNESASWTKVKEGVFNLDKDFYDKSGGIFNPSQHYEQMFMK